MLKTVNTHKDLTATVKHTAFDLVRTDLKQVEARLREGVAGHNETLVAVLEYLVSAGGKRLRPVIALLSARFGAPEVVAANRDKAVFVAAAIEMLHTATLVHDDLVDNALLRRGLPTLHTQWSPGATILTGDYLFARSAGLAAETENVRIIQLFSMTLMTIVNGELNQFFNNNHSGLPSREEYDQRIFAKTASLFATSAETGAILAGLSEPNIQALRDYGYNLGMAFQIMDDILDFKGDQKKLGKPVANDLRQGIATLPVLYFVERFGEHPTLLKAVSKKRTSNEEIAAVVAEIRASGSIQAAHVEARRFAGQAQEALRPFPNNELSMALYDLADYAVDREV